MAVVGIALVFLAWRTSDRMFAFWIKEGISPQSWHEMVSEISKSATDALGHNKHDVLKSEIPESFRRLGRLDENRECLIDNVGDDLGIILSYGSRSRRWGLVVGPPEFLQMQTRRFKAYRISMVDTNAVFYVGSGD